jgi:hypothetical protein
MGWNDSGFSKTRPENAKVSGFGRHFAGREMVSGAVAKALYRAMVDRAKEQGIAANTIRDNASLGSGTWRRIRLGEPIAQTTALKIVTFLGTSLRQVWTKYQQEKK